MSRLDALFDWLERTSDRLSPLVVKEVRQLARGREFHVSFGISLLIGLAVASLGAADALDGKGTSGGWTFSALMVCLGLLGLAVVPLGAFNALRNERLEQTLELITLTALSPRRVVIGKLLAQGVRLATLFAGLAPFVAMSFLLGGIDFASILLSMAILFMWSLWACAACLFLSSMFKTRAMSGVLFGGVGVVLLLVLVVFGGSRIAYFFVMSGGSLSMGSSSGSSFGWPLAIMTSFCLVSMANLVLLAENRLSLPSENRITPLRVGLLVQFLLIVLWTLSYINDTGHVLSRAGWALAVFGGIHLALVALFAVTEDLVLPRRVLLRMRSRPSWQRPFAMFLPGGGRGAIYMLVQMAILLVVAWLFAAIDSRAIPFTWVLAMCGYICFYTGVPTAILRRARPSAAVSFLVRVVVVVLVPVAMLLPDIIVYMWQPSAFDGSYSARHLVDPFRTLAKWNDVETANAFGTPAVMGLIGLLAYVALIYMGRRMTRITVRPVPIEPQEAAAAAGASRGANILS
jgi:hypothetical protein